MKDFTSVETPYWNWVPDELLISTDWTDYTYTGGFYDFGQQWSEQRVTGVNWLTDFQDPKVENAIRVRLWQVNQNF